MPRHFLLRIVLQTVLPTLCLCVLPLVSEAAEPLQLRVLSYNIHHGEGVDGRLDLKRIARVIKSANPDIVALQEVDRNTRRTGNVDQPAELARLTEMEVVFGKNLDYQGGGYGNAVLSRFPIKSHENHHLPRVDQGEPRGVLVVELQPEGADEPILLLATHLDHRPDNRERLASVKKINELIAKQPNRPVIFAGDLNDTPDSPTLDALRNQWTVASLKDQKDQPTFPVAEPKRQIDFVLLRPANRWNVVEVRVLDESIASDHRAILAVLELEAER